MRNDSAKKTAIGGILAALALVIMSIGGLIPVATYVCPLLCMVLGCFVLRLCGRRYGWTWYAAVSVLSLLLGPDKEAVAVYIFLGYYPMIKHALDRWTFGFLFKLLYFNVVVIALYGVLVFIFGLTDLYSEFQTAGILGGAVMLALGNITFILTDKLLSRFLPKR